LYTLCANRIVGHAQGGGSRRPGALVLRHVPYILRPLGFAPENRGRFSEIPHRPGCEMEYDSAVLSEDRWLLGPESGYGERYSHRPAARALPDPQLHAKTAAGAQFPLPDAARPAGGGRVQSHR